MYISKHSTYFLTLYAVIITACVFSLFVQPVFAHGTEVSFEKEIGDYLVDIGYDPEKPEVGLSERFDFGLTDNKTKVAVSFSDVWVRIEKEKNTVFAGGIHNPKFGKAGLIYTFPELGEYSISVRFQNNEETIIEASFPLKVAGSAEKSKKSLPIQPFIWGILGVVIGLLLSKVIKKYA